MNDPQIRARYIFKNDVLYNMQLGFLRIVVPKLLRKKILTEVHDSVYGGHFGFQKTFLKLNRMFYWKHQKQDLYNHIMACEQCGRLKRRHGPIPGKAGALPIPTYAFEICSSDILGPFPPSDNFLYLINIRCLLSRYTILSPLKTIQAEDIAGVLEKELFFKFSCPKILLSHSSTNYASAYLKAHTAIFLTQQRLSMYYNSTGNSLSEHINQT